MRDAIKDEQTQTREQSGATRKIHSGIENRVLLNRKTEKFDIELDDLYKRQRSRDASKSTKDLRKFEIIVAPATWFMRVTKGKT